MLVFITVICSSKTETHGGDCQARQHSDGEQTAQLGGPWSRLTDQTRLMDQKKENRAVPQEDPTDVVEH